VSSHPVSGECLVVPERVIVAPAAGHFRPLPVHDDVEREPRVGAGDTIGFLDLPGGTPPVPSPFEGHLVGMLAHPGERVREGQPLAWLRVA